MEQNQLCFRHREKVSNTIQSAHQLKLVYQQGEESINKMLKLVPNSFRIIHKSWTTVFETVRFTFTRNNHQLITKKAVENTNLWQRVHGCKDVCECFLIINYIE